MFPRRAGYFWLVDTARRINLFFLNELVSEENACLSQLSRLDRRRSSTLRSTNLMGDVPATGDATDVETGRKITNPREI